VFHVLGDGSSLLIVSCFKLYRSVYGVDGGCGFIKARLAHSPPSQSTSKKIGE
jgi:hypothetical protein